MQSNFIFYFFSGQVNRPMLDAYAQVNLVEARPLDLLPRQSMIEWETLEVLERTVTSENPSQVLNPAPNHGNVTSQEVQNDNAKKTVSVGSQPEVEVVSNVVNLGKNNVAEIVVEAQNKEPEVVEIMDDEEEVDDVADQPLASPSKQPRANKEQVDKESLEVETKVMELPWYSGCEYQCKICQQIYFSVKDLRKHISRNHCTPEQYLEHHQIFETKAEYLRCLICDKDVKRSFISYRKHLKEYHSMSLERYEKKFGPNANVRELNDKLLDPKLSLDGAVVAKATDKEADESILNLNKRRVVIKLTKLDDKWKNLRKSLQDGLFNNNNSKTNGTIVSATAEESKSPARSEGPVTKKSKNNKTNGTAVSATAEEKKSPEKPEGPATKNYAKLDSTVSNWYNQCKFECKICTTSFHTYQRVWRHLAVKHRVSVSAYNKKYGSVMEEKVLHACAICGHQIIHTAWHLNRHLKENHPGMDLQGYYKTHIAPSCSPGKDQTYRCDICSGSLATLDSFCHHIKNKHKVTDYSRYVACYGDPSVISAPAKSQEDGAEGQMQSADCHGDMSEDVNWTGSGKDSLTRQQSEAAETAVASKAPKRVKAKSKAARKTGNRAKTANKKPSRGLKPQRREKLTGRGPELAWNQAVYFCPSCPERFYSRTTINSHLLKKNLDPSQAIPGPIHVHKCHICRKRVNCTYGNIRYHFKAKHKMTLQSYERKFHDLLKNELSNVRTKYDALTHPGYDPNFKQCETRETQDNQAAVSQPTEDASNEIQPGYIPNTFQGGADEDQGGAPEQFITDQYNPVTNDWEDPLFVDVNELNVKNEG